MEGVHHPDPWRQLTHLTQITYLCALALSSTPGYSFIRGKDKEPALQVQYEFPAAGTFRVACKVQDDMGGEGIWTGEIEVQ